MRLVRTTGPLESLIQVEHGSVGAAGRSDSKMGWVPFLALAAFAALLYASVEVPLLLSVGALVPVLGLGFVRQGRSGASMRALGVGVALVLVTPVALTALGAVSGDPADFYQAGTTTRLLLLGWALVLWIPVEPESSNAGMAPPWLGPRHLTGLGLVALTIVFVIWPVLTPSPDPALSDEALYLWQSHLMDRPAFSASLPSAWAPFFAVRDVIVDDGRAYSQFPPGWPFLLRTFSWLGLEAAANGWLAAATIVTTFALGRAVRDEGAGLLAAGCLMVSAWFLVNSRGYLSHTATMLALVGSAYLLVRSEGPDARRWPRYLLAGVLLGWATTIRPVSGVLIGSSLMAWMVVRRHPNPLAMVAGVSAGALPCILALLWYNQVTNGDPLMFGYTRLHGELHAFGFGERGAMAYDSDGRLYPLSVEFGPLQAVSSSVSWLAQAQIYLLPAAVALPLLWLSRVRSGPWRKTTPLLFLLLPLVLFFYRYSGLRLHSELLPFIAVAIGIVVSRLWQAHGRLAARMVVAVLVLFVLTPAATTEGRLVGRVPGLEAYFERVRQERMQRGPIVVFVADRTPPAPASLLNTLFALNAPDLRGDVVVVRDLGSKNQELLRDFDGWSAIRLRWTGPLYDPANVEVTSLSGGGRGAAQTEPAAGSQPRGSVD